MPNLQPSGQFYRKYKKNDSGPILQMSNDNIVVEKLFWDRASTKYRAIYVVALRNGRPFKRKAINIQFSSKVLQKQMS